MHGGTSNVAKKNIIFFIRKVGSISFENVWIGRYVICTGVRIVAQSGSGAREESAAPSV